MHDRLDCMNNSHKPHAKKNRNLQLETKIKIVHCPNKKEWYTIEKGQTDTYYLKCTLYLPGLRMRLRLLSGFNGGLHTTTSSKI